MWFYNSFFCFQEVANELARLSVWACARLGGYYDNSSPQTTPDNPAVKKSLMAILTPYLSQKLSNENTAEVFKFLSVCCSVFLRVKIMGKVLHSWCSKGRGMCYSVCGMVHIKDSLLLIEKSSPYSGWSGFTISYLNCHLSLCLTPYSHIKMCWMHRWIKPFGPPSKNIMY